MTTFRKAFINARRGANAALIATVRDVLHRHRPRLSRDEQRGWSTKISFRTYNSLKRQGVLE